jgi:SSS family solute:Na+ symporter
MNDFKNSFWQKLTSLDLFIFFLILFLTALAVWYGERKKKQNLSEKNSVLDLLLLGRQLTLPLFVANLVSTWYGGILGVTQISFESGIYNFLTQGVFWYITYLLFAFFLVDKLRKYEAVTLPHLVGQMFGPRSEKVSAVFNFFNILPVSYALSVGLFLQILFGGELWFMTLVGTMFVVLYMLSGGFRAVVYSDLVQFSVMCLSVLVVVLFCYGKFGGITFLQNNLPSTHFDWLGGHSLSTTLVWGLIALATLVDPSFYQRVFAANSTKTAKLGILFSTGIWILFDFCTTAGGLYARALYPEAESGTSYLVLVMEVLPSGLRGFVLAGILATIVSTLDSFIFIAGTTISFDLLPSRWRWKILPHHVSVIFSGLLTVALSLVFSGGIKDIWKTLGSYSAGCLLLPLMLAHLKPKLISDNLFVCSSVISAAVISYWRFGNLPTGWSNIDALYIGLGSSFIIILGVLFLKKLKLT